MKAAAAMVCRLAARLALALAGLVALAGCNTLSVGQVEPALFPAAEAASAPPLAGRLALVMTPALRAQTHAGPAKEVDLLKRLELPLGAVVDTALQRQLAAEFSGGVQPAALPLPLPVDAGIDLAVVVSAARLDMNVHLNWTFAPIAKSVDHVATLALDLQITDAGGRLLVTTTVDSGRVVLERGVWTMETRMELNQKLLHQAAWQAAAQAARVARKTLQAELRRERAL